MNLFRSITAVATRSIKCSVLRCAFLLISLVLTCLALLPSMRAVTPAPDGSYPGFNTAEGQSALGQAAPGVWIPLLAVLRLTPTSLAATVTLRLVLTLF